MGCRPSRRTASKIKSFNSSGNSTDRLHLSEISGSKLHERKSMTGSKRNVLLKNKEVENYKEFNTFSTTSKTYYRPGSKTSKITLRLSTDGSVLEIEEYEIDLLQECEIEQHVLNYGQGDSYKSRFNRKDLLIGNYRSNSAPELQNPVSVAKEIHGKIFERRNYEEVKCHEIPYQLKENSEIQNVDNKICNDLLNDEDSVRNDKLEADGDNRVTLYQNSDTKSLKTRIDLEDGMKAERNQPFNDQCLVIRGDCSSLKQANMPVNHGNENMINLDSDQTVRKEQLPSIPTSERRTLIKDVDRLAVIRLPEVRFDCGNRSVYEKREKKLENIKRYNSVIQNHDAILDVNSSEMGNHEGIMRSRNTNNICQEMKVFSCLTELDDKYENLVYDGIDNVDKLEHCDTTQDSLLYDQVSKVTSAEVHCLHGACRKRSIKESIPFDDDDFIDKMNDSSTDNDKDYFPESCHHTSIDFLHADFTKEFDDLFDDPNDTDSPS